MIWEGLEGSAGSAEWMRVEPEKCFCITVVKKRRCEFRGQ